MAKGTRLDRANWSSVQHLSASPSSSTKGNIYIDDSIGVVWIRPSGGSWQNASGFWDRTGSILSPTNVGDGLTVAATGGNAIDLSTTSTLDLESALAMSLTSTSSAIDLWSSSSTTVYAEANVSIATGGSGTGNITVTAGGTNGDITIDTGSSSSGNISFTTDNGDYSIYSMLGGWSLNVGDNYTALVGGDASFSADGYYYQAAAGYMQLNSTASYMYLGANNYLQVETGAQMNFNLSGGTYFNVQSPDYLTIGDSHGTGADRSLAFGRYAEAYWPNSIFAAGYTFDTDYTANGSHVISAVKYAQTTNGSTTLQFFDSSDTASYFNLGEGQVLYISCKVIATSQASSTHGAWEVTIVARNPNSSNSVVLGYSNTSTIYTYNFVGGGVSSVVSSGDNINFIVDSTGTTETMDWTCVITGVSAMGYIGT